MGKAQNKGVSVKVRGREAVRAPLEVVVGGLFPVPVEGVVVGPEGPGVHPLSHPQHPRLGGPTGMCALTLNSA